MRTSAQWLGVVSASFWRFDDVPQPDPSGHAPCSIALALLDHSFEEERRSHTIDVQVESALPLSQLLLGVQSFLDRYLHGCHEEDPIFDLSESLAAFSSPEGIGRSTSVGFASPSQRCLAVTHGATGSGLRRRIGSPISWCRLWWTVITPSFRHSPHLTSVPQLRSRWLGSI